MKINIKIIITYFLFLLLEIPELKFKPKNYILEEERYIVETFFINLRDLDIFADTYLILDSQTC